MCVQYSVSVCILEGDIICYYCIVLALVFPRGDKCVYSIQVSVCVLEGVCNLLCNTVCNTVYCTVPTDPPKCKHLLHETCCITVHNFIPLHLCNVYRRVVCRGSLEQHFRQYYSKLGQRRFCM